MAIKTVELDNSHEPAVPPKHNNSSEPCCDTTETGPPFKQSPDLITVEGLFVALMQTTYLDADKLRYCVKPWVDNKAKDTLFIDVANNPSKDQAERHPAVYVELVNLISDSSTLNGIGSNAGVNLETGAVCLNDLVRGQVVFNHVCRTPGEAKSYASNTFSALRQHSYAIKKMLCFEKLDVASIVKPSIRESKPDEWNCPVTMTFEYVDSWELVPNATLLKQVELNLTDYCTNIVRNETIVK